MTNLEHPANRAVLAYLGEPERLRSSVSEAALREDCSPAEISDPYYKLGTHPDLVTRLWDELGKGLPADCRRVVFGTPALVRPESGVLFGFAGGSHTYALRLPAAVREAALSAGATTVHRFPAYPELGVQASVLDLSVVGSEWVLGGWYVSEPDWCRAAYEYAK